MSEFILTPSIGELPLSSQLYFDFKGNGIAKDVIKTQLDGIECLGKKVEIFINDLLEKSKIDVRLTYNGYTVQKIEAGSNGTDFTQIFSILGNKQKFNEFREVVMGNKAFVTALIAVPLGFTALSLILGGGVNIKIADNIIETQGDVILSSMNSIPDAIEITVDDLQKSVQNFKKNTKAEIINARKLFSPAKETSCNIKIDGIQVLSQDVVKEMVFEDEDVAPPTPTVTKEKKTLLKVQKINKLKPTEKLKVRLPELNRVTPEKLFDAHFDSELNIKDLETLDFYADVTIETTSFLDNKEKIIVKITKIYDN